MIFNRINSNKSGLLVILWCLCSFHITQAQLPVAHSLYVTANSTNSANSSIQFDGISDMFVGCIDRNSIQMHQIEVLEDGEITLEIIQLTSGEELVFQLTNEGNSVDSFAIKLMNNKAWLVESNNGQNRLTDLGAYVQGDEFKIIRCNSKILYQFKGILIHATALVDNNFTMYGELYVTTTMSSDFKAYISFHPL